MKSREISIVGFGRFGQLLASILSEDCSIKVYDKKIDLQNTLNKPNLQFVGIDSLLKSPTIFYCVPISDLEKTVIEHLPIYKSMQESKLLIDVLSVKLHPQKVFKNLLPDNYQVLLTHPMFGPDNVKANGLIGQTLVIDRNTASETNHVWWKNYFINKKVNVVEMTADEHDRLAAKSQGVTHLIGRMLDQFNFTPTPIDTIGAKHLHSIKEQTCNDTWQLFEDLQTFNPYTSQMRSQLGKAFNKTSERLNKENCSG